MNYQFDGLDDPGRETVPGSPLYRRGGQMFCRRKN